jgi:sugar phosphate isomerase/epimerase
MARLSVNEMTTYRWSFEEDVSHYRAAGIKAIGVWRQKLADFGEDKGIELLADSGLTVSNLLWAGGFTGSDGHSYQESLRDAGDAIRLAAQMKAGSLVVYSGGRNGHTQNHARRLFQGALKEMLPLASELRVVLAIEPMHVGCAGECTFLTTLQEAQQIVETINSPWLKVALDTYHFGNVPGVLDQVRDLAGRIGIVHLGDGSNVPDRDQNRQRLCAGTVPLGEIIGILKDGGYDGYYDVELMGEEIEASNYHELLVSSKQTFEELTGAKA